MTPGSEIDVHGVSMLDIDGTEAGRIASVHQPNTPARRLRKVEIAELREAGMTAPEIHAVVGGSLHYVYSVCAMLGMGHPRSRMDEATVRAMAARGATQPEIAAHYGVSVPAVCRYMRLRSIDPSFGIARKKAGAVIDAGLPVGPGSPTLVTQTETEPFKQHSSQVPM